MQKMWVGSLGQKDHLTGVVTKCDKCGGRISKGDYDIRNRQYTYPRII